MRTVAVLLLFVCSTCFAEETVEIPLSEIWAMDMPGTKPMNRGLKPHKPPYEEGSYISEEGAMLDNIRRRKFNDPAAVHEGFAVVGTGMEALRNAYNVLVKHERPKTVFTAGDDLSIVFFTWRTLRYIHLHDVKRNGNQVVVRYKFVPHQTLMESQHLALIPLHNLPVGKYDVVMERMPLEDQYAKAGWEDLPTTVNVVSKSFSFTVEEKP